MNEILANFRFAVIFWVEGSGLCRRGGSPSWAASSPRRGADAPLDPGAVRQALATVALGAFVLGACCACACAAACSATRPIGRRRRRRRRVIVVGASSRRSTASGALAGAAAARLSDVRCQRRRLRGHERLRDPAFWRRVAPLGIGSPPRRRGRRVRQRFATPTAAAPTQMTRRRRSAAAAPQLTTPTKRARSRATAATRARPTTAARTAAAAMADRIGRGARAAGRVRVPLRRGLGPRRALRNADRAECSRRGASTRPRTARSGDARAPHAPRTATAPATTHLAGLRARARTTLTDCGPGGGVRAAPLPAPTESRGGDPRPDAGVRAAVPPRCGAATRRSGRDRHGRRAPGRHGRKRGRRAPTASAGRRREPRGRPGPDRG